MQDSHSRLGTSRGEDSPPALANKAVSTATASQKHGAPARPEGEEAGGHAAAGTQSPVRITRASARIAIAFGELDDERRKALYATLETTRKRCATGANYLLRTLQRLDEDALDAFIDEHGRLPQKGKELPPPKLKSWGYHEVRKAAPEAHSKIAAAISKMASNKWMQTRWAALVFQTERPVRYRLRLPIPIPAQDWAKTSRLLFDPEAKRYKLLLAFEAGKPIGVPLKVRDAHQRRILDHILAFVRGDRLNGWKPGELKIEQDYKRPGRWYIRLAYSRLITPRTGGRAAAFHRGIRNMFVLVTEDGESLIDEGRDVEAHLAQMESRRKAYQRQSRLSGRAGHGRKRILRPIEPLLGKATRWRQTRAQTAARRAAEWLVARGVTRVVIEDLTGLRHGEPEGLKGGEHVWKRIQRYPIYDHGMRFRSCCEEAGIEIIEVPAAYHSQRCPACGHVDESHRDLRWWKLRCSKCSFSRDLDIAAALNALERGEAKREGRPSAFDELPKPKRKRGGARKSPRRKRR
jgi:transposase